MSAQKEQHRLERCGAYRDQDGARHRRRDRYEREQAVRPLGIAFAHRLRHQGGAARAQHESDGAQRHGQREHEVHGRQRLLAGEIRHEQAVHHAVDGREYHHGDGGQCEAHEAPVGEMVG